MKISQLIKELKEIQEQKGDLDVELIDHSDRATENLELDYLYYDKDMNVVCLHD